jgi:hypothetical protein
MRFTGILAMTPCFSLPLSEEETPRCCGAKEALRRLALPTAFLAAFNFGGPGVGGGFGFILGVLANVFVGLVPVLPRVF